MLFRKKKVLFRISNFHFFTILCSFIILVIFLYFFSYLPKDLFASARTSETLKIRSYAEEHQATSLTQEGQSAYLHESLPAYLEYFSSKSEYENYIQRKDYLIHSPWRGNQYVKLSWSGCVDIFRKQGADIIILGASDSAYNLPLDLVQQELKTRFSKPLRVLLCSRIQMSPLMLYETLKALSESPYKAKLIIWGYGAVSAQKNQTDDYNHFNEMQNKILHDNLKKEQFGFGNIFSKWQWKQKRKPIADRKPIFIPDEVVQQNSFETYFQDYTQVIPFITDEMSAESCKDFSQASQHLELNLKLMKQISDRVYVYLTPTTGVEYPVQAQCFLTSVVALLNSFSGNQVQINTQDWLWYGLQFQDFIFPYQLDGEIKYYLNPNHNNYPGAKKIVSKILQDSFFRMYK